MKKTSAIVVLGGGLLQCPLVIAVNSLGYRSIVVDQNPLCHARYMATIFLCISIREYQDIYASLRRLNRCVDIIDIQTIGTDFTFQRNYLRRKLRLECLAVYHVLSSNHKYHMRKFLQELRVPIPTWKKICTYKELKSFVQQHEPVVLKPVDNMGARGVALLDSTSNIKQQLVATLHNSSSHYALAETVIPGQEYSVDVVVSNGVVTWCGIAQRVIILRPYFIEIEHYFSSEIRSVIIRSLKKTIRKVARSIPARHYQLKFDIFYANGVAYVNEFASRLSGGFMSGWTYPVYTGIRPAELIVKQHARKRHALKPHVLKQYLKSLIRRIVLRYRFGRSREVVVAEGSVISIPGLVNTLPTLSTIRALPTVVAVFAEISPGDTVRFPQNNIDKCFHIIVACHPSQHSIIFMKIRAYLLPRLTPQHNTTEQFLSGSLSYVVQHAYILEDRSCIDRVIALVTKLVTEAVLSPQLIDALAMFAPYCDWHGIPLSVAIKIMFWKYRLARLRSNPNHIKNIVDALIKGGLQGALYYIDTIHSTESVVVEYVDTIKN